MNDLTAAIAAETARRRDELLELLAELIAVPTETSTGAGYPAIVDRLGTEFAALGFTTERVDLPDDVVERECRPYQPPRDAVHANLLARRRVGDRPQALWYTHLDTVPAGPRELWDTDPFTAVVDGDFVIGRGASDSKGAAAALVTAFRVLDAIGAEPSVSPMVALTTDEEIGPYTGLMYLADTGALDGARWFHSCDGTATNIGIGYCGALNWTVAVRGESVHSGISYLGRNPVEGSLPLLEELLATKAAVQERRSRTPAQWPWPEGRERVGPLLNVTMARAGVKHNVVPATFTVEGDRRIIPEEDWDEVVAELHETVDRARRRTPGLDLELTIAPFYRDGWAVEPDAPFVTAMAEIASTEHGERVRPGGSSGSSDVSHTARRLGVPTVSHGLARPGESRYHSPNERARISDLLALVRIICRGATELGAPPEGA
ncbi:M20 family metallopeptidase [Actinomadura vinacea]|uniref:M20 family metallopeptidase n=1 Tax=Actinomadura vinacea TaxID=115336 RepID=A0ABP5XJG3_9ACTN